MSGPPSQDDVRLWEEDRSNLVPWLESLHRLDTKSLRSGRWKWRMSSALKLPRQNALRSASVVLSTGR